MKRPQLRRAIKWAGTTLVVSFSLILLANIKWRYVIWADIYNWQFVTCGGGIQIAYFDDFRMYRDDPILIEFLDRYAGWTQFGREWSERTLWPLHHKFDGGVATSTPIWLPIAVFGLPTLWLWRLDRRRPAPGACRCGYDLTGNTSGRCPECGTALGRI